MLSLRGVSSGYGDVTVLQDIDLTVGTEIFAVLGANGAGKSTLLKTIARFLKLKSGSMTFDGTDVSNIEADKLAAMGLGIVPQERNIFASLTVRENLSIGTLLGTRSRRSRIDEVFDLFPDIRPRANQNAGSLSGGEAQMVAMGRCLVQEPKLILLDEPTTGLSPKYQDQLIRKIHDIHKSMKVSVLLSEQNANKALKIADRVIVLSVGKIHLNSRREDADIDQVRAGYHI
ncbi:MAG: ABC transporter ATP-binding protein [Pseudomonadota bacterium]